MLLRVTAQVYKKEKERGKEDTLKGHVDLLRGKRNSIFSSPPVLVGVPRTFPEPQTSPDC